MQPAALLLTPAPIESLKRDLDYISDLGPHFYVINMAIRRRLEDDTNADQLRATLMQFNTPMYAASMEMEESFFTAGIFYTHGWPDGEGLVMSTEEGISRLLDPRFQADSIEYACEAESHATEAARIVRNDVLPQLSPLEKDLQDYVDDYFRRMAMAEERKQSWIPSFLHNPLFGALDPTPWDPTQVKELPQRLAIANSLLRQLPAFLDNWALHFRRLSELDSQKIYELGYRSHEDLVRLYQDRVSTTSTLNHVNYNWYAAHRSFRFGALKELRR